MYSRSKHSPKKSQGSSKTKDIGGASSSSGGFKAKEIKSVESPQANEDKEITLPVFKTFDSEKDLQCYASSTVLLVTGFSCAIVRIESNF